MENSDEISSYCCSGMTIDNTNPTEQCKKSKTGRRKIFSTVYSFSVSLLIALFPKCPVCWAAYLSIFGSYSIAQIPYLAWLMPVLTMFLGIHLFFLFQNRKNKGLTPFLFSLFGAAIIIGGKELFPENMKLIIIGMILILFGSIRNSFSFKQLQY